MAHSDLLCLALAWTPDRPDDRSCPQPNQWTWDQPGTTVRVRPRRRSPSMMAGRAATVADRFPPPSCNSTIARPDRGRHPPDELVGGDPGMPVGRVDNPQHGPLPEPLGRCQDGRGGGAAWWPEPHRPDPQRPQGAPTVGDFVANAGRRQPVEGLGVAPGV